MTNRTLRTTLAVYETGAGLGGIWMLLASGQFQLHGPLPLRIFFAIVMAGYCALLAVSGVLLGRNHPVGVRLSLYAQVVQVPQLVTRPLTFMMFTPASITLTFGSNADVGFFLNVAAELKILFGRRPEVTTVGVNLLALFVLYLLKYRLTSEPRPASTSSVAA
jgi:hypothetical protein